MNKESKTSRECEVKVDSESVYGIVEKPVELFACGLPEIDNSAISLPYGYKVVKN